MFKLRLICHTYEETISSLKAIDIHRNATFFLCRILKLLLCSSFGDLSCSYCIFLLHRGLFFYKFCFSILEKINGPVIEQLLPLWLEMAVFGSFLGPFLILGVANLTIFLLQRYQSIFTNNITFYIKNEMVVKLTLAECGHLTSWKTRKL